MRGGLPAVVLIREAGAKSLWANSLWAKSLMGQMQVGAL